MEKFSIVVPVYNTEKYVEECIRSVLRQTYDNWELILVDDGSSDHSGQICDTYAQKDARIFSYHKENEGQLATRTFGIGKATGDFLVFLDADDMLADETLQVLQDVFSEDAYDCVIYGMKRFSENANCSEMVCTQREDRIINDKRELYRCVVMDATMNVLWRKAFRAHCIVNEAHPEWHGIRHGEDLLHSLQLLKHCQKVKLITDVLYLYRDNPEGISQKIPDLDKILSFDMRESVYNFLKQENVFLPEDFCQYRDLCARLLVSKIRIVCKQGISYKEKLACLKKMGADPFYLGAMNRGKGIKTVSLVDAVVFALFNGKMYGMIIFAGSFGSFCKRRRKK